MTIFLGGDASRREFQAVVRDVQIAAARCETDVLNVSALKKFSKKAPKTLSNVDFFVLLRSFPNEFSPTDVERLRRAAPLAPIALIAGTLCEGENRTGATFPGTRRFYLGAWRTFGRREFFRFFAESSGLFAAPPVATEVDRIATSFDFYESVESLQKPQKIAIFADADPVLAMFLRDEFLVRGSDARLAFLSRFSPTPDFLPERIVVDSIDLASPTLRTDLSTIRRFFPSVPLALLAFAPRVEEREFWENGSFGPICVISKPFEIEYLLQEKFFNEIVK